MELNSANLLEHLADFACNLKFEDLPPLVVHEAKRRVYDSLGCLIMAVRHDEAVKLVRQGMYERSLRYANALALGMPGAFSPEDAAYLNTHAIRALDWNDTYLSKESAHPSDNIGALLALPGTKVDGKSLITALVLAYDIQCRFCDAASLRKHGFDHTAYVQIASAFSVGKLLKLNQDQMKHAAALALLRVPLRQGRAGSKLSHAKALYAADAASIGAKAALLASLGATGPAEILEGEYGFMNQCLSKEKLDLEAFSSLGRSFRISNTHIKLYPVEYHAQAAVEAGLILRQHVKIDEIERISIRSYEAAKSIIGRGRAARRPETKESADHSLFYVLALAMLEGKMTLDEFHPSWLRDARVWGLIDKMEEIEELAAYTKAYYNRPIPEFPVYIIIRIKNGWAAWEVKLPKGHFANPITDDELRNKFGEKLENLEFVWGLEKMSAYDLYWQLRRFKT